jgi:single-strand DNA-binding protein
MQFITITGRVGGNAETRQAGSGTVTSFSCAVDQGWGERKQTNWFRVSIWGDRGAKLAQYIVKGDKITATGELVIGEYQGKPQYEVRAADVDAFMAKRDGSQGAPTQQRNSQPAHAGDLDDDVPFLALDPALEWRVS